MEAEAGGAECLGVEVSLSSQDSNLHQPKALGTKPTLSIRPSSDLGIFVVDELMSQ